MNKVNLEILSDFVIVLTVIITIAAVLKLTIPNTI